VEEFVKIGTYLPVKDGNGRRPPFDEAGDRREVEFEEYPRLAGISLKVDPEVSAETRRFVEGTIDQLRSGIGGGMATIATMNWETSFQTIAKQTIVALRDDATSKVKTDQATLETFFKKFTEWADLFPILGTIRHALDLSDTKKKSWNSLFE